MTAGEGEPKSRGQFHIDMMRALALDCDLGCEPAINDKAPIRPDGKP
jgi:hypothetical protein